MKIYFLTFFTISALTLCFSGNAVAQQKQSDSLAKQNAAKTQQAQIDSLAKAIAKLQADNVTTKTSVEILKRFSVTGYIQAQWQLADTAGINSFSGGNFPKTESNRFMVRSGYVNFIYRAELTAFQVTIDANEKGVSVVNAYGAVTDPWLKALTLTAGIFDRPYGFENPYSSALREAPERSRLVQTTLVSVRDLGAKLTFQPPKGTKFDFLKLDIGLLTGNAINPGYDNKKDFISRLAMAKANKSNTLTYGLGVSYYNGFVFQGSKYVYDMGTLPAVNQPAFIADSASDNINGFSKRIYYGADFQASLQSKIGLTTFRIEFITGKQPGSSTSSISPNSGSAPTYNTYNRNFEGGYIYLIQNIGKTKNQFVAKFDWYDPNTKVSGDQITLKTSGGVKTNLTSTDVMFSTLGLGWNYFFNTHVRLTAFYEFVSNETTLISGTNSTNNYTQNLTDNVLTIRIQYRF